MIANSADWIAMKKRKEWLNAEYVETVIDWASVPMDTPIIVSAGKDELRRYFAGYDSATGTIYCVPDGMTDWSFQKVKNKYNSYQKLTEMDVRLARARDRILYMKEVAK